MLHCRHFDIANLSQPPMRRASHVTRERKSSCMPTTGAGVLYCPDVLLFICKRVHASPYVQHSRCTCCRKRKGTHLLQADRRHNELGRARKCGLNFTKRWMVPRTHHQTRNFDIKSAAVQSVSTKSSARAAIEHIPKASGSHIPVHLRLYIAHQQTTIGLALADLYHGIVITGRTTKSCHSLLHDAHGFDDPLVHVAEHVVPFVV